MANKLCYVEAGSDDGTIGTDTSTTSTTLRAIYDITQGFVDYGWAAIQTSGITTANVITAATLYWYHVSYTKSDEVDYSRIISIADGATLLDSSANPGSGGWKNYIFNSTASLENISLTGKTTFYFEVADTADEYNRYWSLRSKNNTTNPTGTWAPYLSIDYDPVATGGPTIGYIISL
jgi:hypothetical protein